jgi:hypothetical protein
MGVSGHAQDNTRQQAFSLRHLYPQVSCIHPNTLA